MSVGNNFQGLKYGFCHQSSGGRKRRKSWFNWFPVCSSLADETGSKENLRLLAMIKITPFFNTECKNG